MIDQRFSETVQCNQNTRSVLRTHWSWSVQQVFVCATPSLESAKVFPEENDCLLSFKATFAMQFGNSLNLLGQSQLPTCRFGHHGQLLDLQSLVEPFLCC